MPVSKSTDAALRDGFKEFRLFLAALTVFSLAVVWGLPFPPLQDYPMRLFIGFAAATFDNPSYNWADFFELHNSYGSFSFTFWFLRIFNPHFGIEMAGKLLLSVYVCSVSAFAFFEARKRSRVPWALLMLVPLAFNQTYIIGLMGYFVSIPFLMFALRNLQSVAERPLTPRRFASHLVFQSLIFFCHPFTSVVYVGLAGLASLLRRGRAFLRSFVLVGGFAAFFVLWYESSSSGGFEFSPRWWPLGSVFEFFLLMFSGMTITNGPDRISAGLWLCIFAFTAYSAFRMRGRINVPRSDLILLIAAVAGFAALPFSPGSPYTYFNLRLAAVVYFLGAVVLSYIGMCRAAGRVFAVLIAATAVWQGVLHYKLSAEISEIKPIMAKMEKNSVVLPAVADGKSAHLDPLYFYQFHNHVPEYYHFLVGGGANPELIDNPGFPIKYRHPQRMLAVAGSRDWKDYACCYRYVIARGKIFEKTGSLGPFRKIAHSGLWHLFEADR